MWPLTKTLVGTLSRMEVQWIVFMYQIIKEFEEKITSMLVKKNLGFHLMEFICPL